MNRQTPADCSLSRRQMLCRSGLGFGWLAFAQMLAESGLAGSAARAETAAGGNALGPNPLAPSCRRIRPRLSV